MISWFQALLPREDNFFRLFNAHAATLPKGAEALRRMLDGGDDLVRWNQRLIDHEHEADGVAREVLFAVRRSFVTPLDRSDIRGLTNALDDSIDQMQRTGKLISLYEMREFPSEMRQLGDIAIEAAKLTVEAVEMLAKMSKNSDWLNTLTEQIAQLESDSDALYDAGMKALYDKHKGKGGDAMAYLAGTQVYDSLERVIDRFEDVANRISGILVEHL